MTIKISSIWTKVVLINKVVLGGLEKGDKNEPYFWHIFGVKIYGVKIYHRQARPNPGNWEWPGLPVINFDPINFDPKNMAYFYPLFYGLIGRSWVSSVR